MDFRYKRHYQAPNGEDGKNKKMFGKDGENLVLKVPPGTIIKEEKSGQIIADLTGENTRKVVAHGGKGGRGNTNFKTATRQAPKFATAGELGEELTVTLELKLIADVGLVGFPNVGKSTILSIVTSAKPKVADYHFTTLTPNLGVVSTKFGDSFVLADIPGLIEGAHTGVGLGHEFLRHVERTKVLIHVIDVAGLEGRDPIEDFEKINSELKLYSEKLVGKPQIVAANKIDIPDSENKFKELTDYMSKKEIEVFPISAATNRGMDELFARVSSRLKEVEAFEKENPPVIEEEKVYTLEKEERYQFTIEKEKDTFIVEGKFLLRLIDSVNFDDMESLSYFQKTLRKRGIIDKLKDMGIQDGDTVKIYDVEFEYYE